MDTGMKSKPRLSLGPKLDTRGVTKETQWMILIMLVGVLYLSSKLSLFSFCISTTNPEDSVRPSDEFRWDHVSFGCNQSKTQILTLTHQITPSSKLIFQNCFGSFQCARLELPMDWNDPTYPEKVAVAITLLPSKVPINSPYYGGPILINPGGPGISSIGALLERGHSIQDIVDPLYPPPSSASSELKYFDILSFDPRGVNNTTPHLPCFPTAYEKLIWNLPNRSRRWVVKRDVTKSLG